MMRPLIWRVLTLAALAIVFMGYETPLNAALADTRSGENRVTRLAAKPTGDVEDQTLDILFHPIGLSASIGLFIPSASGNQPSYPTDDPGDQGTPTGTPSGSTPPPQDAPEPSTLVSAMVGLSALGFIRWRRRQSA